MSAAALLRAPAIAMTCAINMTLQSRNISGRLSGKTARINAFRAPSDLVKLREISSRKASPLNRMS
jgi:hypothetical protein